ncbi:protein-L-isoaspartate O-methyltransferase family protein [Beijerinckia indica]|uniref:Protein-L-isoaspartate O-methyltransferase n=1 Tax=Beijerinckia indica subsp. indica (strain ATCC 9039 / DSM 1715 / NCIMB 8712) TaxID=395963 RepID=B2ICT2_BEII9|nr:protein-L-isoaspartate O-methyltransferase [Beijerinckia indica]ACB95356.1 protein-L-isoaspartate(D-aspartate) O-methyltransferase [Beijerinckia indica subsp. indica ATCC 9039]
MPATSLAEPVSPIAPAGGDQSAFLRQTMVDCQVRTFDVTDQRLLERMLEVPRESFLPASLAPVAYSDKVLRLAPTHPAGAERHLLPPLILARLIQGAQVTPNDHVLDIASGSGYSTALLAGLAHDVVALESEPEWAAFTRNAIAAHGLQTVSVVEGPLAEGVPAQAPFDLILINGAVEAQLETLFAQLQEGGRLLALTYEENDPTKRAGKAVRFEKIGGEISQRTLFDFSLPVLEAFARAEQFKF